LKRTWGLSYREQKTCENFARKEFVSCYTYPGEYYWAECFVKVGEKVFPWGYVNFRTGEVERIK
jgi:hypothetical protein